MNELLPDGMYFSAANKLSGTIKKNIARNEFVLLIFI